MSNDNQHLDPHQRAFVKLLRQLSDRHQPHRVFSDFCEVAAISLSNAVDRSKWEEREQRYLSIAKNYTRDEMLKMSELLCFVVESLQSGMKDTLGQIFMALEFSNHWKGQYFTPYPIAKMMAMMTVGEAEKNVAAKNFMTAMEPAAGSGVMIVALAETLQEAGINYQERLHATAIDVDSTAVHMAYITFSLLHIPAIVICGNTIAGGEVERWFTPAHVRGYWDYRLLCRALREAGQDDSDSSADATAATGYDNSDSAAQTEGKTFTPQTSTIADITLDAVRQRLNSEQLSLF